MSHPSNTELLERAAYVKTQYEGTIVEEAIDNLIKENDLEKLAFVVGDAEVELAKEEYYAEDTIDTY